MSTRKRVRGGGGGGIVRPPKRIAPDTFDRILHDFKEANRDPHAKRVVAPFVWRWVACAKRDTMVLLELYRFVMHMAWLNATRKRYLPLADVVDVHGTHFNTNALPFTRLFGGILRLAERCTGTVLMAHEEGGEELVDITNSNEVRRTCLRRLFRSAYEPDSFSWYPLELMYCQPWRWDPERTTPFLVDIGKYLCIVSSLAAWNDAIGVHHYVFDHEHQFLQRSLLSGADTPELANAMLLGWEAAHFYVRRPLEFRIRRTLGLIGWWYQYRSWPSDLHREVSYRFLSRLWCVITPTIPYRLSLWCYQSILPLLINRSVRFRIGGMHNLPYDDILLASAFEVPLQLLLQTNRACILRGGTNVVRQVLERLLCPEGAADSSGWTILQQNRLAPFVQGVVMQRIVSFLCRPPTQLSQIVRSQWPK